MYNYLDEQGVAKLSELINSDIAAVDSRVEDVENALTTAEISASGYTRILDLKSGVPFNYISVKGKNIIYSFTERVSESAGIIPTYDDDNITVTLNGTPQGTAFIDLFNGLRVSYWNDKTRSRLKPGVYTISSSTFDNNMFWGVEKRRKSDNQWAGYYAIGVASPGANYLTFTITEEDFDSFYPVFRLCVNPGESYSDFIVYPQIEEGSVATEHATSFIKSPVMFLLCNDFVYAEPTGDPFVITQQCTQQEGSDWIDIFNTPSMPIVTVNYNTYKTPLSAVYNKINGVDSRVSAVESSVSGMSSEISDLTSRVSYNEIAIQTNIENIAAVDTRVDNAESEIAANTGDINSLGGRVDNAESEIAANTSDITSLDNRVTALEQGGGGGGEITVKEAQLLWSTNANYDSDISSPALDIIGDNSLVYRWTNNTRFFFTAGLKTYRYISKFGYFGSMLLSPYRLYDAFEDTAVYLQSGVSPSDYVYSALRYVDNGVLNVKGFRTSPASSTYTSVHNAALLNKDYLLATFYVDGTYKAFIVELKGLLTSSYFSPIFTKELSTITGVSHLSNDIRYFTHGVANHTNNKDDLYIISSTTLYKISNYGKSEQSIITYTLPAANGHYPPNSSGVDAAVKRTVFDGEYLTIYNNYSSSDVKIIVYKLVDGTFVDVSTATFNFKSTDVEFTAYNIIDSKSFTAYNHHYMNGGGGTVFKYELINDAWVIKELISVNFADESGYNPHVSLSDSYLSFNYMANSKRHAQLWRL